MKVTSAMLFMAVVGSSVGMLLRDSHTEDRHERQVAAVETETVTPDSASAMYLPGTAPASQTETAAPAAPAAAPVPVPETAPAKQTVRTVSAEPEQTVDPVNPVPQPETQTTDLDA
ncbi:MAG: hypothetical protein ACR2PM_12995, partial [Hyphomicrobiales bacterium]